MFYTEDIAMSLHFGIVMYIKKFSPNEQYFAKLYSRFVSLFSAGPTPLDLQSTIVRQWTGGFVGEIEVPISSDYTAWKIILEFNRRVSNLFVSIVSFIDFRV